MRSIYLYCIESFGDFLLLLLMFQMKLKTNFALSLGGLAHISSSIYLSLNFQLTSRSFSWHENTFLMEKNLSSLTSKVAFLIMFMVDQYTSTSDLNNADNIKKS